jgi:hypothetical protein
MKGHQNQKVSSASLLFVEVFNLPEPEDERIPQIIPR